MAFFSNHGADETIVAQIIAGFVLVAGFKGLDESFLDPGGLGKRGGWLVPWGHVMGRSGSAAGGGHIVVGVASARKGRIAMAGRIVVLNTGIVVVVVILTDENGWIGVQERAKFLSLRSTLFLLKQRSTIAF